MTSQGSPLTRLQRALAARNVLLALSTAAELPRVPLPEALAIALLLRDKEPQRFEAAALRWHARLCRDARLSLSEATIALAGLSAIAAGRIEPGTQALLATLDARGLSHEAAVLERWLDQRSAGSAIA
jgi:hypothetical protein